MTPSEAGNSESQAPTLVLDKSTVAALETLFSKMLEPFDKFLKKLEERLEPLEALPKHLGALQDTLQSIDNRVSSLERTVKTEVETVVQSTAAEVQVLQKTCTALQQQYSGLQSQFQQSQQRNADADEQQRRSQNAVLFGVSDEDRENEDTKKVAQDTLAAAGADPSTVVSAQRLGKPDSSVKARPMRVVFNTVHARDSALRTGQQLRTKKIAIDIDLTPRQLENRAKFKSIFQKLKDKEVMRFFRGDSLVCIVDGKRLTFEPDTDHLAIWKRCKLKPDDFGAPESTAAGARSYSAVVHSAGDGAASSTAA